MKPIETKTTNCVYTLEGCHDLPATNFHSNVGEGVEVCFEVSDEELEEIKKSKRIYLDILGRGVPPMCLNTYTSLVESEGKGDKNEQIN